MKQLILLRGSLKSLPQPMSVLFKLSGNLLHYLLGHDGYFSGTTLFSWDIAEHFAGTC